jgi:hypothetical protein
MYLDTNRMKDLILGAWQDLPRNRKHIQEALTGSRVPLLNEDDFRETLYEIADDDERFMWVLPKVCTVVFGKASDLQHHADTCDYVLADMRAEIKTLRGGK